MYLSRLLILSAAIILLQSCVVDDSGNATSFTTVASTENSQGDGIVIAQASDIIVDDDNINLDQAFAVRVVDGGSSVSGAVVTVTITPVEFYKGGYTAGTDNWVYTSTATCTAETVGNDTNGNGNVDPAASTTLTAHPTLTPTITSGIITTNSNGEGYFSMRYGRDYAGWVNFSITASVTVDAATITTTYSNFSPSQLAEETTDLTTGFAGIVSPYGVGASCNDVN